MPSSTGGRKRCAAAIKHLKSLRRQLRSPLASPDAATGARDGAGVGGYTIGGQSGTPIPGTMAPGTIATTARSSAVVSPLPPPRARSGKGNATKSVSSSQRSAHLHRAARLLRSSPSSPSPSPEPLPPPLATTNLTWANQSKRELERPNDPETETRRDRGGQIFKSSQSAAVSDAETRGATVSVGDTVAVAGDEDRHGDGAYTGVQHNWTQPSDEGMGLDSEHVCIADFDAISVESLDDSCSDSDSSRPSSASIDFNVRVRDPALDESRSSSSMLSAEASAVSISAPPT